MVTHENLVAGSNGGTSLPESNWKEKHKSRVVDDFSYFQEGEIEPTLGKKINFLVIHEEEYIVYLDAEDFVEWSVNAKYGEYPTDLGTVTNRVGHLEALSMSLLAPKYKLPFRRLLAEGLARALSERNSKNALVILDHAEAYMTARSREMARTWYLSSASIVTATVLTGLIAFLLRRDVAILNFGRSAFEVLIGAGVGSLGALLSIIWRSKEISMDASAGWKVHYLESAARVVVGVAGAFFVALAIKANLVLGSINSLNSLPLIMVVGIVAGASERLVPNLIKQIEGTVSLDQRKKGVKSKNDS